MVSDFRLAHMSLVAGIIAFLGFLNKEKVTEFYLKYGIFLLLGFVSLSIITIILSYYKDSYASKSKIKYLEKYNKLFIQNKQRIEKLNFSKEDAKHLNTKLKEFSLEDNKIVNYFIIIFYIITWGTLIVGMIFILLFFGKEFNLF